MYLDSARETRASAPLPALSEATHDPQAAAVEALIDRARKLLKEVREPSRGDRLEQALDELERALSLLKILPEALDRVLEEMFERDT